MPVVNGKVVAPIDFIGTIAAVLGSTSGDCVTLCRSLNINKWAKYKPERFNQPNPITLEQRKNNNFGLTPAKVCSTYDDLRTGGGFDYNRIQIGDFARITDFEGYKTNAVSPFPSIGNMTITYPSAGTHFNLKVPLIQPIMSDDIVQLKDLSNGSYPIKDWYMGVMLYNSSRTLCRTEANTLSGNPQYVIDFGSRAKLTYKGDYSAVPFLSNKPITSDSVPSGLLMIPTGETGHITIKEEIAAQSLSISGSASGSTSQVTLHFNVILTNNSTASRTFSGIEVWAAQSSSGANSQRIQTFANVSVAASDKGILVGSGTYNAIGASAGNTWLQVRSSTPSLSSAWTLCFV